MKKQGFLCKISWQKSKQTAENVNKLWSIILTKDWWKKHDLGGKIQIVNTQLTKSKQSADKKSKQTAENVNK